MRKGTWKAVAAVTAVLVLAGLAPRVMTPVMRERAGEVAAMSVVVAGEAGAMIARVARHVAGDLARRGAELPPEAMAAAGGVLMLAGLGLLVMVAVRSGRATARRPKRRTPRVRDRGRVLDLIAGGRPVHGVARRLGIAQDGVRVLIHTAGSDQRNRPGRIRRPAGSAGAAGRPSSRVAHA